MAIPIVQNNGPVVISANGRIVCHIATLPLRITTAAECRSVFRNLKIQFGVNPNRKYYNNLVSGRLRVAYYSTYIALQKLCKTEVKEIGRVEINPAGYLERKGRPVLKSGVPVEAFPLSKKSVSADVLFPEYEISTREVSYNPCNAHADVKFLGLQIDLPVDPEAALGPAVKAREVFLEGNSRWFAFYRKVTGDPPRPPVKLGEIKIDEQGRLVMPNGQFYKRGEDVVIATGSKSSGAIVKSWELLECFALKDQQVSIAPATGRAVATYRKVAFEFSTDKQNIYLADLVAGRLFLRTGFFDRIEVVRKIPGKEDEVLGRIRLTRTGRITSRPKVKRLDKEGRINIADLVEELSARDVPVTYDPRRNTAYVAVNYTRFYFPVKSELFYAEALKKGELVLRAYNSRMELKRRTAKGSVVVGRAAAPAKSDSLWKYANGGEVFPELLACRKIDPDPKDGGFSFAGGPKTVFVFPLGLRYVFYQQLSAGRIYYRQENNVIEVMEMKEDGEERFLGPIWFDAKQQLIGAEGTILICSGRPVTAGKKNRVPIAAVLPIMGLEKSGWGAVFVDLSRRSIRKIDKTLQRDNYYHAFREALLLGEFLLAGGRGDSVSLSRIAYIIIKGMELLSRDQRISARAVRALAAESFACLENLYRRSPEKGKTLLAEQIGSAQLYAAVLEGRCASAGFPVTLQVTMD